MIYANHLHNLATSKPRISMAEIEAICIDKAKQGELYCWVHNPIANEDIQRLKINGFEVVKHNNASYRIDWSQPTNI
jgi:endonuclease I